jgi:hypothetical protein
MEFLETPIVTAPAKTARQVPTASKDILVEDGATLWKPYEKITFRFFFVYFLIQAVPLDWKYYRDILALDWSSLHFSNFFYLARYTPRFISDAPVLWDWLIAASLAVVVTASWTVLDKKHSEYNKLYYWLRVVLRYRLAAALLVYGFIKFFPLQMPEPSLSNLNTNYGDIAHWKVFSLSTGIVPGYESFLGLVELLAALLLLYRKTASIGAFLIIPFTGNVVMSNLAYEGGEYVYSLLLVTFALFLLAYDLQRLLRLTTLEKYTLPPRFKPVFTDETIRNVRILSKSIFVIVFVFFYGYKTYASYTHGPYQFPASTGLPGVAGIYTVAEFKVNNRVLSYSPSDPERWNDVVFETWATLSVRSHVSVETLTATTEEIFQNDEDRVYEFSGMAGRHYYTYTIDSVKQTLTLKNRNPRHAGDQYQLQYERPDQDKIIFKGVNSKSDSLYIVLNRLDKKYLLEEAARQGRRRGLKL